MAGANAAGTASTLVGRCLGEIHPTSKCATAVSSEKVRCLTLPQSTTYVMRGIVMESLRDIRRNDDEARALRRWRPHKHLLGRGQHRIKRKYQHGPSTSLIVAVLLAITRSRECLSSAIVVTPREPRTQLVDVRLASEEDEDATVVACCVSGRISCTLL